MQNDARDDAQAMRRELRLAPADHQPITDILVHGCLIAPCGVVRDLLCAMRQERSADSSHFSTVDWLVRVEGKVQVGIL